MLHSTLATLLEGILTALETFYCVPPDNSCGPQPENFSWGLPPLFPIKRDGQGRTQKHTEAHAMHSEARVCTRQGGSQCRVALVVDTSTSGTCCGYFPWHPRPHPASIPPAQPAGPAPVSRSPAVKSRRRGREALRCAAEARRRHIRGACGVFCGGDCRVPQQSQARARGPRVRAGRVRAC